MITKKKIKSIKDALKAEYEAKLRTLDDVEIMMQAVGSGKDLLGTSRATHKQTAKDIKKYAPMTKKRLQHGARKEALKAALSTIEAGEKFTTRKITSIMKKMNFSPEIADGRNMSSTISILVKQGILKRAGTNPVNKHQLYKIDNPDKLKGAE